MKIYINKGEKIVMRIFTYFIVIIVSIIPIITHIFESNYIVAALYVNFFIFALYPFIKRFMSERIYNY